MEQRNVIELFTEWSSVFMQASMHEFNKYARSSGISMLQLTVLTGLYHHGPHEVTAFAEIMQISPAGASQMVERLVQEGLVVRQPAVSDRRVREVHLTEQGRILVEASNTQRNAWLAQIVEGVPARKRMLVSEALELLSNATANIHSETTMTPDALPGKSNQGPFSHTREEPA